VRAAAYPQPTFCHLFVRKLLIINDALRIMRRLVRLSMTKCGAERARVWQCGTNRQAAHPLALTGAGGLADCCRDCGPHAGRPLLRRGAGPGLQLPGRTGEPVGRPGSASRPTDNGFELRLCRRTGRCCQRGVGPGRPATLAQRRRASSRAIINGWTADVVRLKAKGLGLRDIARELKMPPSSVHKALRRAA
jgi:hypothetical protein